MHGEGLVAGDHAAYGVELAACPRHQRPWSAQARLGERVDDPLRLLVGRRQDRTDRPGVSVLQLGEHPLAGLGRGAGRRLELGADVHLVVRQSVGEAPLDDVGVGVDRRTGNDQDVGAGAELAGHRIGHGGSGVGPVVADVPVRSRHEAVEGDDRDRPRRDDHLLPEVRGQRFDDDHVGPVGDGHPG